MTILKVGLYSTMEVEVNNTSIIISINDSDEAWEELNIEQTEQLIKLLQEAVKEAKANEN